MKSTIKSAVLLALFSTSILAETVYHNEKRDVKFVLQVSLPGASTPSVSYERSADPSFEPKVAHRLTPLG